MKSNISVIIPTIPRRGMMLSRAVSSVSQQTLPPDSILVPVDHNGLGAGPTRNEAAVMATTEWIAFLDDDDLFCRSHLESLMDCIDDKDADMVYPWFTTIGASESALLAPTDDGELVSPEGLAFGPVQREHIGRGPEGHGSNFIPVTYLIRRELFLDLGGFPETNSGSWPHQANEDWGFLIQLCRSDANIEHLPIRTWIWNFHSGSTLGGAIG
jgi:hypothetical protein